MADDFRFLFPQNTQGFPPWHKKLSAHYRNNEEKAIARILKCVRISEQCHQDIKDTAIRLTKAAKAVQPAWHDVNTLMHEYDLSSNTGRSLMSLAEAVLRIPDSETADDVIYEKICHTDWSPHIGVDQPLTVNASAQGLMTAAHLLKMGHTFSSLHETLKPFAETPVRYAVRQSVIQGLLAMARAFVLGSTIEKALDRAANPQEKIYRFSFDMLGEAARTEADALRYFQSYQHAAHAIGQASNGRGVIAGPALSVKLSALHPRYEMAQRATALPILADRLLQLAHIARQYDIGLCVDAEEAERLELSLEIIEQVFLKSVFAGMEWIWSCRTSLSEAGGRHP